MNGNVYINEEGKFLVLSERTTHTGKHIDIEFMSDINRASVLARLEREVVRRHPELEHLQVLPAELEVIRTVRICKKVTA